MVSVTQEQNRSRQLYGGGGSSNPAYLAASKNLNFAVGSNTMLNARAERVTAIPYVSNYKDSVGLFGAENIFLKVDLNIQNTNRVFDSQEILNGDYFEANTLDIADPGAPFWESVLFDFQQDLFIENDFEPVEVSTEFAFVPNGVVRVDLENLKTGNRFIDSWFDVRLYTKDRQEYPYDTMYIGVKDYFYIGFHARNTKRLPYNVRMTVGSEIISTYQLTPEQRKYLVS